MHVLAGVALIFIVLGLVVLEQEASSPELQTMAAQPAQAERPQTCPAWKVPEGAAVLMAMEFPCATAPQP